MPYKSSNPVQVDGYLLWWRFRQVFLISSFVAVLAVVLSGIMYYRFHKLHLNYETSIKEVSGNMDK
uniref:Uncharacterized protein n=1 Tax=Gloeothece verrucosa (strain PCC 7822) TaxID=497965 RepID=E0U8W6_GLOV7|nr:hypothetical protein Cyan7822_3025 [Gloeothece verrucosa PCC 7822]